MHIQLPKPGKYIVAVSGGLDSVCLLDILFKAQEYQLIVAHFDHGIRPDSRLDARFVENLAGHYGLSYETLAGNLGNQASEAVARTARYKFLQDVRLRYQARAIVTAHHRDDKLETAMINLLRGTGRRGLSSLQETPDIKRPLLDVSKTELKNYITQNRLSWREDSTNNDVRYLRNYIRHKILPRLSEQHKAALLLLIDHQAEVNMRLDNELSGLIGKRQLKLSTDMFNLMPYDVSKELMATWLRANNLLNFDHKTIERLTVAAKTKRPGTVIDVSNRVTMTVNKEFLALNTLER